MKRDRLSIHISDSAEIFVEERKNGIKSCKCISLDDLLVCIKSSIREIKPVYRAVLPKNALFYSCCPETGDFSAAMEYPYNKADITYMNTEYRDFPLPKLVFGFKVAGKKIKKVYLGITGNGILRESSLMYTYPFSNVSKDFVLCTGGNALPEIKSPYSLSNMPDYILSLPDNDDYYNIRHNRLELGHRELMEHLADKSPEYYYSDILIPSGKTLADFYKEVSL